MIESKIMLALELCFDKQEIVVTFEDVLAGIEYHITIADILELLNHKRAENEKLEKEYDRVFKENEINKTEVERLKKLLDEECDTCACGLLEQRDKARAEAIKEVLLNVKTASNVMEWVCKDTLVKKEYTITEERLDQIEKEMEVK